MVAIQNRAHTGAMNHEKLFEQAVALAYETFGTPSDEHVIGVFAVLVWYGQQGLVPDKLTVH